MAKTDQEMLAVAIAEARAGLEQGGIPIGAALFDESGVLLGSGHNRRVQDSDPSIHGETDAFRNAGRVGNYGRTTMVTTLAPCWYCSGLIRQFGIGRVLVGESKNFSGGADWLIESGVEVIDLHDSTCIELLGDFISANEDLWHEDIGTLDEGDTDLAAGVQLLNHPLARISLTHLRDKATGASAFREHSAQLGVLLIGEALGRIPVRKSAVDTPLVSAAPGWALKKRICFVPVLRAGLALLDSARGLVPDAAVGFIGMERDEETAVARAYYQKMPDQLKDHSVFLLDPMLATGGSMVDALKSLLAAGAKDVTVVCVVAAPEGIRRLRAEVPGVRIIAAAVDDRLDENAYIVPGLGDYGDRYFGT